MQKGIITPFCRYKYNNLLSIRAIDETNNVNSHVDRQFTYYKVKEIAKDTGVNVFTVATRIRRLKIKLRKYYEKQK